MIEPTEDTRIQRMFAEGKLTDYAVKCLRSSLDAQTELGASFHRKPILVLEHRLGLLLGFLSAFFLLSVGMPWLIREFVSDVAASVAITDLAISARQQHRLIDHAEVSDERSTTMNRSLHFSIGVVTLGMVAVLGALFMILYNGLVSSREQVNAGWAQVENVYQRRLDLVPLLVDAVQTYTEHERETLTALTEARARAIDIRGRVGAEAPKTFEQLKAIEASQGAVKSELARLLAVVENYPDLKASQNFLTLQDQIEGTENRVTMERRNYNEFSRRHNTRMQTFPFNIVAELMGFKAKPYFEAEDKALKGLEDPFGRDKS